MLKLFCLWLHFSFVGLWHMKWVKIVISASKCFSLFSLTLVVVVCLLLFSFLKQARPFEFHTCRATNTFVAYSYLGMFSPFRSLSIRESAYVKACSIQKISRLDSQSKFQMYCRCTPTWWLHTRLCKFVQNISRNINIFYTAPWAILALKPTVCK